MRKKINISVIGRTSYAEIIKNTVSKVKSICYIGAAMNVEEAKQYVVSSDVLLLDADLISPNENSILDELIKIKLVPIIILADGTVFHTTRTVYAMSNGAVDFIKLTSTHSKLEKEKLEEMIVDKIIHGSNVRVKKTIQPAKKETIEYEPKQRPDRKKVSRHSESIVAIGSSTGGPRALQQLLQDIPKDFTAPIFIVQHMPSKFTKSLANRMNNVCHKRVKEAANGEIVQKGTVYIAPGNYHMKVVEKNNRLTIQLTKDAPRLGHRPSVNELLDSIALLKNMHKVIVILTGMGRDGSEGIEQVKKYDSDAIIIAESQETAIINGMPSAAIATNYVTEVLRIEDIGEALVDYTNTRGY